MLPETKRLHISPLDPATLPTVLRPSLANLASDISFHTIVTFPERSYAFVTLPTAEADQLKRKLQGAVLRGMKMKVEEARPKKSKDGPEKEIGNENMSLRKGRTSKMSGKDDKNVLPGVELEEGRKIKRGWTEPDGRDKKGQKKKDIQEGKEKKKSRKAGSVTGKEECLFKAKIPPNARNLPKAASATEGKAKKRKRGQSNGEVIVHEFRNTERHAAFLRENALANPDKAAAEFIDGKGWVDQLGNVVETGPAKRTRKALQTKPGAEVPDSLQADPSTEDDDATSSSGSSSSEEQESGDDDDLSAKAEPVKGMATKGLGISGTVERLSITRSSATPPPLSAEEPIPTLKSPEPHPLETLFKRPAKAASQTPKEKPPLEVSTAFSFSDPDGQETEARLNIPQTPFTQQDFRQRRERSAAPTPDTALPGKTFGNVWGGPGSSDIASESEEEAGEEEAKMLENMSKASPKEGEQSEFAKWFYENRGENNRAWKRRRREAAKEKRQSDNRKRRGD